MSGSDFKVNLLKYSGINYDTKTMDFPGSISADNITANNIYGNVIAVLPSTANVNIVGNVTGNSVITNTIVVSGNATAAYFIGNGALLTGVTSSIPSRANLNIVGNVTAPGNVVVLGKINTLGNVTATYLRGNGALLSGIATALPGSANIDIVGNVTAPGNITVAGQVTTVGNVSANYFLGNGALLQGVLTSLPTNANINIVGNVTAPGNVSVSGQVNVVGNVTANYILGNGALLSGINTSLPANANINIVGNVTAPGNISVLGQVNVVGNVTANYFLGNGALLSNVLITIPSNANIDIVGNVTASGNVSVLGQVNVVGNVTANYFIGNGALLSNVLTSLPSDANIDIVGNVTAPGNMRVLGQVTTVGNVVANYFLGNSTLIEGILTSFPATGNIDIVGNVRAPGNVVVQGQVNTTGNIVANYFIGNGTFVIGATIPIPSTLNMDIAGNVTAPGNAEVTGLLSVTGNMSAQYYIGDGAFMTGVTGPLPSIANLDIIGNVTAAGNIVSSGNVAAIGNMIAAYFVGNGYLLRGVLPNIPRNANVDIVGNVTAPGNISVAGQVTAVGNVVANYFVGNGALLSNVADAISGIVRVDVRGNVEAPGNIVVSGRVITSGNVTANYFVGNGALLSQVLVVLPASANIDINGNILSGNLLNVASITTSVANIGNVRMDGGNITANYFIGNGAFVSNVLRSLPATASMDIIGNVIGNVVSANTVTIIGNANVQGSMFFLGNVSSQFLAGNGQFLTLPGFLVTPRGTVANQAARLALNVSVGTIVTQTDNGITYLLNSLPASTDGNWTVFNALANPVSNVFGRQGSVVAQIGDYTDIQVGLSANVGNVTTSQFVANALAYLNAYKANVVNGNLFARYFVGGVSSLGNVDAGNVTTNVLQVNGNLIVSGQVNVVGNIVSNYLLGDGSQITGLTSQFPSRGNLDIVGNSTSAGNVIVLGQVTTLGNVTTQYLYANIIANNITANTVVVGQYVDTQLLTSNLGNITAVNFFGNLVAIGNVTAPFFIGNARISGNVIANNVSTTILRVYGNAFVSANVSAGGDLFLSGNMTTAGNVVLSANVTCTSLPNVDTTTMTNYQELVVNSSTGLVSEVENQLPNFGDFVESTNAGTTLYKYKGQLLGIGTGWSDGNFQIAGYPSVTGMPTVRPFAGFQNVEISKVKYSWSDCMILAQDGRVFSFGTTVNSAVPVRIDLPPARDIFIPNLKNNGTGLPSGYECPLGVTLANGQLYMFGLNTSGQLGRGTFTSNLTPVIPAGLNTANVIKLTISTAGFASVCAVLSNGRIATWGYNSIGQLGIGNTSTGITVPVFVSGFTNVTDAEFCGGYDGGGVGADNTSLRILLANGASFASGSNRNGELGTNNLTNSTTFVRENTNRSNIAAIGGLNMVNVGHYIIQNDGQVLFTGNKRSFGVSVGATTQNVFYNGDGISSYGFQRNMLANVGTFITTPQIKFHASASQFQLTDIGCYWAMFKDNTGNLWTTGNNKNGQLGVGNIDNINGFTYVNQFFTPANSAVHDFNMTGFIQSVGTIVVLNDGRMLCTGNNGAVQAPYEAVPSNTAVPYWRPAIGFELPMNYR
jgi:alpha-tubulin suppressor-like RCC1 family protein/cytoskeletal protein CcmA (bactofilin family)